MQEVDYEIHLEKTDILDGSYNNNIAESMTIKWGARLYLHAMRPGNFLSSAEDANRVRGCYQVCFPSVGGLEAEYTCRWGGGRPVFSSWDFMRFGGR